MNKQTEALKLALEALEEINKLSIGENAICLPAEIDTAMDAIREALADSALERMAENARELGLDYEAAQQQEPVAYSYTSRITGAQGFSHHPMPRFIDSESWDIQPLYTSPPASKPWVGLTDEEIETYRYMIDWTAGWSYIEFARAIEAAHGIKGEA